MKKKIISGVKKYDMPILLTTLAGITLALSVKNIFNMDLLYMTFDEFGYWGTAAYLAEYDWSPLLSRLGAYYGYGYSFFLAPIFYFFDNATTAYHIALALNAVMMAAIVPIAYIIGVRISNGKINRKIIALAAFCVSIYPANLVQSNIAWPECYLIFLFWVLTLLLFKLIEKPTTVKLLIVAILTVYLYIIHQRMLAVVMAIIFTIFFLFIAKKINKLQFAIFIFTVAFLFVFDSAFKEYVFPNAYGIESISQLSTNTYGGMLDKLLYIFTPAGCFSFIQALAGQVLYLGSSTFFMFYLAMFYIVKDISIKICSYFKHGISKSKIVISSLDFIKLFLLLSMLATIFISALFMINPSRVDHIFYGRYNEAVLGVFVFVGAFLYFCEKQVKFSKTILLFFVAIQSFLAVIIHSKLDWDWVFHYINIPSIYIWFDYKQNFLLILVIVPLVVFIITIVIKSFLFNRYFSLKYISIALVYSTIWYMHSQATIQAVIENQEYNYSNIAPIVEEVEYLDAQGNLKYCYFDESNSYNRIYPSILQFAIKNSTIDVIEYKEDLSLLEDGDYFVTTIHYVLDKEIFQYANIVTLTNQIILWQRDESKDIELKFPLSLMSSQVGCYNNQTEEIVSDGDQGYISYGPYIQLPSGEYAVTFDIDLIDFPQNIEILANIDIVGNDGEKIVANTVLNYIANSDDKQSVTLEFVLEEDLESSEFRVFVFDEVFLELNSITIQRK